MYAGKYVFAQVMEHPPMRVFRKCIARHGGNRGTRSHRTLTLHGKLAAAHPWGYGCSRTDHQRNAR